MAKAESRSADDGVFLPGKVCFGSDPVLRDSLRFPAAATCYAEPKGRDRPIPDGRCA